MFGLALAQLRTLLSACGLTANTIGTILVWRFGLPEPIDRTGAIHLVVSGTDQTEIDKAKIFDRYSRIGVSLLVLGFALQLIAVLV